MTKVIGLGAGGHAKTVIEILRLMGDYEIVGLLDPNPVLWETDVLGIPVLGDDSCLRKIFDQGVRQIFIGVGSVGDNSLRKSAYDLATAHGFEAVRAVHSHAVVSTSAKLGQGVTIMAGAIVNASATIGVNVIINTGAIVEHDCLVGDHVHLATGSRLCGSVVVGADAHVGAGATVRQSISIGEGAIIAAGAAVVKGVEPWSIVGGVPARVIERLGEHFPDS